MTVQELGERLQGLDGELDVTVEYPYAAGYSMQDYAIDGDIVGFDVLDAARYLIIKVRRKAMFENGTNAVRTEYCVVREPDGKVWFSCRDAEDAVETADSKNEGREKGSPEFVPVKRTVAMERIGGRAVGALEEMMGELRRNSAADIPSMSTRRPSTGSTCSRGRTEGGSAAADGWTVEEMAERYGWDWKSAEGFAYDAVRTDVEGCVRCMLGLGSLADCRSRSRK